MKVLPQELIDDIFKYTDLETVTNYPESSDYIIKYMTNKEKDYLYDTYKFMSDLTYTMNSSDNYYGTPMLYKSQFKNIICNGNKEIHIESIFNNDHYRLNILEDSFTHINNLQLKIYNPLNKKINDIIDNIQLIIGGNQISIINIDYYDAYIDIYNNFYKLQKESIKYINDYIYLSLPFLNEDNLLCKFMYHETYIDIIFKKSNEFNSKLFPILYGDKYNITNVSLPKEMKIFKVYIKDFCRDTSFIYIRGRVQLLSIIGDFSDTDKLSFIFDPANIPDIKIDISVGNLNLINKSLGYDFKYPTFLFNEYHSNKYINFNYLRNISQLLINGVIPNNKIKILVFNTNILRNESGMGCLRFN